jgi:hypothetical protein
MKKLVLPLLLLCLACKATTKENTPSLSDVLENYYKESLALYRLPASYQGDTRYDDTLPNYLSPEFQNKEKAFYNSYLEQIKML